MPDVVIQGEAKKSVGREKPALDLPVKHDQPLEADVESDDGVRSRVPADLSRTAALTPGISESPLVAAPSSNWIVSPWRGEAVRVLFPKKELQAVGVKFAKDGKWDLIIADSQGKAFRKYSGVGEAPERVEFDGKGDDAEWLAVGHAYTPVLTYKDSGGRVRTAMGRPFALAGLSFDAPKSVRLSPRALFTGGASPELTDAGKAMLREATLLLARRQPGLPIELGVYLVRGDAAWVKAAGDACAKEIARTLLVKPESIAVKQAPGTQDLKERIELLALAR